MYKSIPKEQLVDKYDSYFDKVIDYARNNLGLTVKTNSKTFEYDAEEQVLYCSSRLRGDVRYICYLLHELGHHNQPDSVFHSIPRSSKNKQICVILEQEYTAWKIGWEIALYLGMDDLWSLYVKEWSDAWMTYVKRLVDSSAKELKEISGAYYTSSIHPFTFKEY
jgi:hypothetical protein